MAALIPAALLTAVLIRPCSLETELTETVRLVDFTTGLRLSALSRYQIRDIRVGDVSVRHLFKEPERTSPGWLPGGYIWPEDIDLHIKIDEETPRRLEELKRILMAHPDRPVEIVLRDAIPIWSRVSGWACGGPYEYSIGIPVKLDITPCDVVTRVVYEQVISKVMKEENVGPQVKQAQADRRLEVDEVFDRLRDDRDIEALLKDLGPVKDNPCLETIKALKENKEEQASRFGLGEYELREDIRGGLRLIINAAKIDPGWWKSSLSLKVTGFTDRIEVDPAKVKNIDMSQTGIGAEIWSKMVNPLQVYFSGCQGNKVESEPVYLSFIHGQEGQSVGYQIDNNCELGALRAYVATVYLTNELGRISPDDVYATGGIYSGSDTSAETQDDPKKRRVHVEFIIRAAKVEQTGNSASPKAERTPLRGLCCGNYFEVRRGPAKSTFKRPRRRGSR